MQDACVVHSSYRGVGFEPAGLEALLQWRYPTMEHNILLPVKVKWSLR